jgi:alcohol dehydrogenase class IV
MTDPLALSCIELVSKHLKRAWTDPNDHDSRLAQVNRYGFADSGTASGYER